MNFFKWVLELLVLFAFYVLGHWMGFNEGMGRNDYPREDQDDHGARQRRTQDLPRRK
jgi:hypothetical protein